MGGFVGDVVRGVGDVFTGGAGATRDAIGAQRDAAEQANATQRYMYDTTRADMQPWREAGMGALGGLTGEGGLASDFNRDFTMSDFQADPGYQFRMSEGMKAIERSAAARGGLNSGATLKALTRYGQDVASQEYQNAYNRFNADRDRRFNRLSALAGIGQTAQTQVNAAGQNYANQVSGNQIGLGNAIGAAYIGQANRMSNLVGQGAQAGAMLAMSDRRAKKDIEPVSKEDLDELKSAIKAYRFKYKSPDLDGDGEWIGVMAQDLEKTKLGKTIVVEDKDGFKKIDIKKATSLLLAALAA